MCIMIMRCIPHDDDVHHHHEDDVHPHDAHHVHHDHAHDAHPHHVHTPSCTGPASDMLGLKPIAVDPPYGLGSSVQGIPQAGSPIFEQYIRGSVEAPVDLAHNPIPRI